MNNFDLGVLILTGVAIISTAVLIAISVDVSLFLPITSALIGWVVGRKQDSILNAIKPRK